MPKLPSLREEVAAYPNHHGPICSVCRLPQALLDEINEVLRDGPCHAALHAALKKRGVLMSRERIGHHYREGHHEST